MTVHVQGTVAGPKVTEPESPYVIAGALRAGKPHVITVGPYVNTGDAVEHLSDITVTNEIGVTVNSAVFIDGSDALDLASGLSTSVNVNVTADDVAAGESADFSFDVDVAGDEVPAVTLPVEPPVVTP